MILASFRLAPLMKTRALLLLAPLLILAACDRQTTAADPEAERRRIELEQRERDLAQREADLLLTQTDQERQRLAEERAALEADKQRLATQAKKTEQQQRAADAREEERRLAGEKAAAERAKADARQAAQAEQKLEFFYEALDPYGDWIEVPKYGYCWQPRQAQNPRWRPYTDGKWVYSDYGWTWVSNEKFGWAAYHYGRWTRVRGVGWVWVPGSEWAPAWVSWRRGENHVGWAPLPPEAHSGNGFTRAVDSYYDIGPTQYTFVPVESIGEPTYVGKIVEPERNVTIINETVNVTNITYKKVENRTVVVNEGPDLTQINVRARQPVRQTKVQVVRDGREARPAERKGDVIQMIAPLIASAARAEAPPAKIKRRAEAAEVDRGWSDLPDQQAVQRVRAKLADEARSSEAEQRRAAPRKAEAVERQAPQAPQVPAAESPEQQRDPEKGRKAAPRNEHGPAPKANRTRKPAATAESEKPDAEGKGPAPAAAESVATPKPRAGSTPAAGGLQRRATPPARSTPAASPVDTRRPGSREKPDAAATPGATRSVNGSGDADAAEADAEADEKKSRGERRLRAAAAEAAEQARRRGSALPAASPKPGSSTPPPKTTPRPATTQTTEPAVTTDAPVPEKPASPPRAEPAPPTPPEAKGGSTDAATPPASAPASSDPPQASAEAASDSAASSPKTNGPGAAKRRARSGRNPAAANLAPESTEPAETLPAEAAPVRDGNNAGAQRRANRVRTIRGVAPTNPRASGTPKPPSTPPAAPAQ